MPPGEICGIVAQFKVSKTYRKIVIEFEPDIRPEGWNAEVDSGKRLV
jgi:hypothetical protein